MKYVRVSSSNIESVGYEEDSQTLGVCFKGGGEYHYLEVPRRVYDDLLSASSVGRFFDSHIKKAGYPYKKIR